MRARAAAKSWARRYKNATRTCARCVHCANGSVRDSNCRRSSASSMVSRLFTTATLLGLLAALAMPAAARAADVFELKKVQAHARAPVRVEKRPDGVMFIDFGRDAIGWL